MQFEDEEDPFASADLAAAEDLMQEVAMAGDECEWLASCSLACPTDSPDKWCV